MKADTRTIRDIFQGDRRFVVPVYQRPYVWNQEKQWEPLWGDIEATARRLAETRIDGHKKGIEAAKADQSAAPHFLGAVVIEARAVMTGDVDTRLASIHRWCIEVDLSVFSGGRLSCRPPAGRGD
ncbi:DUF262 domain-containing protein, partial [Spirillospora sp. NPDC127506]